MGVNVYSVAENSIMIKAPLHNVIVFGFTLWQGHTGGVWSAKANKVTGSKFTTTMGVQQARGSVRPGVQ